MLERELIALLTVRTKPCCSWPCCFSFCKGKSTGAALANAAREATVTSVLIFIAFVFDVSVWCIVAGVVVICKKRRSGTWSWCSFLPYNYFIALAQVSRLHRMTLGVRSKTGASGGRGR